MKNLFLLIAFIAIAELVIAQQTNHTRATMLSPLGGGTGEYIQNLRQSSSDPFGLAFFAGGVAAPRMTILDSGNVGIGNSSPTKKLEVATTTPGDGIVVRRESIDESGGLYFTYGTNPDFIGGIQTDRNLGGTNNGGLQLLAANNRPIQFYIKGGSSGTGLFDTEETMRINGNGKVGIGTTQPASKLHIDGGKLMVGYKNGQFTAVEMDDINEDFGKSGIAGNFAGDLYARSYWGIILDRNGGNAGMGNYVNGSNPDGGSLAVRYRIDDNNFRTDLLVNANGNVGIGTTNPDKGKLQVVGSLHVENEQGKQTFHVSAGKQLVFVGDSAWIQYQTTLDNPNSPIQENNFAMWVSKGIVSEDYAVAGVNEWDDYVFNEDYDLPKLEKVAAFVKANKHLPNIPSEAEVKKNGYSIHLFNRGILKTTEELTLYIIEQDEEIKALKEKTQQQDAQLKALQEKTKQYEQLAAEVAALKVMLKENKK